jgi:hypothetical protein
MSMLLKRVMALNLIAQFLEHMLGLSYGLKVYMVQASVHATKQSQDKMIALQVPKDQKGQKGSDDTRTRTWAGRAQLISNQSL